MLTQHLKDALAQVRQLQQAVLERQRFRGYSGPARIASGSLALLAAIAMASPLYPATTRAHVLGWGGVFIVALLLNTIALLYWFLYNPNVKHDPRKLLPLFDSIPAIIVGAALTFTLILHGWHEYLFGVWMCMFGLSNLASRYVLPRPIILVGLFYIACGVGWLVTPNASFLNPLPMGFVFFAGEWAGGLILYFDQRRYLSFARYLDEGMGEEEKDEHDREQPQAV
ncbi:MAG: hypothetical protein JXB04_04130 [Kiritimatiellae bacterium]|nr:hypothetical protein [Kiritimatiellia bacterium]